MLNLSPSAACQSNVEQRGVRIGEGYGARGGIAFPPTGSADAGRGRVRPRRKFAQASAISVTAASSPADSSANALPGRGRAVLGAGGGARRRARRQSPQRGTRWCERDSAGWMLFATGKCRQPRTATGYGSPCRPRRGSTPARAHPKLPERTTVSCSGPDGVSTGHTAVSGAGDADVPAVLDLDKRWSSALHPGGTAGRTTPAAPGPGSPSSAGRSDPRSQRCDRAGVTLRTPPAAYPEGVGRAPRATAPWRSPSAPG